MISLLLVGRVVQPDCRPTPSNAGLVNVSTQPAESGGHPKPVVFAAAEFFFTLGTYYLMRAPAARRAWARLTCDISGKQRQAVVCRLMERSGISFDAMPPAREEPTIDRDVDNDHHTGKRELDFCGEA